MKKYTINVYGYGGEITIGRLTDEQVKFISESDVEELYDLIYDDDLGCHWAEIDDIYHNFGASDCSILTVEDEDGNEVYKIDLEDPTDEDIEMGIIDMTDSYFEEDGSKCLVCCSHEKGNFFSGELELEGDFDPSKLKVLIHEDIGLHNCYVYGNMVREITYDGEEVDNYGGDTTGKSFDVKINF